MTREDLSARLLAYHDAHGCWGPLHPAFDDGDLHNTGLVLCRSNARARGDGEAPIFLFDVRDNRLDQQFYDDFETMVREVLGFVDEILDEELGEGAEAGDAAERSGDRAAAY